MEGKCTLFTVQILDNFGVVTMHIKIIEIIIHVVTFILVFANNFLKVAWLILRWYDWFVIADTALFQHVGDVRRFRLPCNMLQFKWQVGRLKGQPFSFSQKSVIDAVGQVQAE